MGSYSDLLVEEGEEWKRGRMEGGRIGKSGRVYPFHPYFDVQFR
jgi:hypothetical protein